jgi:hypothetical protein
VLYLYFYVRKTRTTSLKERHRCVTRRCCGTSADDLIKYFLVELLLFTCVDQFRLFDFVAHRVLPYPQNAILVSISRAWAELRLLALHISRKWLTGKGFVALIEKLGKALMPLDCYLLG